MTNHFLAKVPILGKYVDERCLEHRRRSTSMAGITGGLVAGGILEYQLFANHVIHWDLFAVLIAMMVVKITMMTWYRFND